MNTYHFTKQHHLVLNRILSYLNKAEIHHAKQCLDKLIKVMCYKKALPLNKVLIAYGGGKDSSYMLAYVRLLQLLAFKKHGHSFQLRVATNRHAGMPYAVMENIHRAYTALNMHNDPFVELILIDGNEISKFDKDSPMPKKLKERNRLDILMSGHRVNGDGRPTFCNACNLSMANSFWLASSYNDGVDIIITGDSKEEQLAYYKWVSRLTREITEEKIIKNQKGFSSFLKNLDSISKVYFEKIYGENNKKEIEERRIKNIDSAKADPFFFSIYQHTDYNVNKHWGLLTEFLKFEFDDLAFSFSETDCANPALMAHIRGLKAEHVYHRAYSEGILDYLKLALKLMRIKNFPDHLILKVMYRYLEDNGMVKMREKLEFFAQSAFDLTTEQLICMVYSPFIQAGKNLADYIDNECPSLIPYLPKIHDLLKNQCALISCNERLISKLVKQSGLSYDKLCVLYNDNRTDGSEYIIKRILRDDPHKTEILTHQTSASSTTTELISGR